MSTSKNIDPFSDGVFGGALSNIRTSEVAILRHVHRFPVYGQDIISPHLMVCINHSGTARFLYDMQERVFSPREIAVVLPNHILHPIENSADYSATILIHSVAFSDELKRKRQTGDHPKFHRLPACRLTDDEMTQFMKAVDLLEHICLTPHERYPLRHEMLIDQMSVMSEMLNACRRNIDEEAKRSSRSNHVFNDFCDLLALHYREQHEVGFYADKVHLSPRHFSVVIKATVGVTASDYIEEYIATRAQDILKSRPDVSVQEVGYYLGFAEPPSFCRFFKRVTGQTPGAYKQTKT